MPILNSAMIRRAIKDGKLVRDARKGPDGEVVVEPASYDLRVGAVVWKGVDSKEIRTVFYDPLLDEAKQETVTLQPGQMVFVVTHEELALPEDVSGTVYSRNKLQKENILALNAGHVDPGYEGPILIRLINLGAAQWPLQVGDAVFTVVFHTVTVDPEPQKHAARSKQETLDAARKAAVQAFSNPLFELYTDELDGRLREHHPRIERDLRATLGSEFVKKDELKILLWKWFGILVVTLVAILRWSVIWDFLKRLFR